MPYITVMQTPRHHQVTLDEILNGEVPMSAFGGHSNTTSGTITRFFEHLTPRMEDGANVRAITEILTDFNRRFADLFEVRREDLYYTFYIPKRSGGMRRIDAPSERLMEALRQLKSIFENDMNALYHTAAFAYVRGRSALGSVKRHQANESKWFLKTDFSNFFGSTTMEFTVSMLEMIYPFSEVLADTNGRKALTRALDLCFLNGGLPQGTPISPMLTNLIMIPIDHDLQNSLLKNGFVYTRYADDILISSKHDFEFMEVCRRIDSTLGKFHAPFSIKQKKTRYGSSSGSNWNLGVMLNKDNKITIGHKQKDRLHAALTNYVRDRRSGTPWEAHDVQVLSGQLAYYRSVEPDYIAGFIRAFNAKNGVNVVTMIHDDIKGSPSSLHPEPSQPNPVADTDVPALDEESPF